MVGDDPAADRDPETVNKMKDGRSTRSVAAFGCNQGCIDRLSPSRTRPVCTILPPVSGAGAGIGTLMEATFRRRVVVIGAGPAGMKAAEIARDRATRSSSIERRARTEVSCASPRDQGAEEIAGVVDHLDVMIEKYAST